MFVSNTFLRFGVLALICGVALGVWMGHQEDFTLRSVHAHINLIGWASMMIFGFFYRLFPDAGSTRIAKAHLGLSILGFCLMIPGLTLLMLGNPVLLPALLGGEVLLAIAILMFAVILFRETGRKA